MCSQSLTNRPFVPARAEGIENMNWIAFTERLPDAGQLVLVVGDGGSNPRVCYFRVEGNRPFSQPDRYFVQEDSAERTSYP